MGLGGVGVLGFVHPYHWLFVGLAILLLVLSFYLNMVRRRTPANVAVFLLGAAFVVTMIGYTFLR